MKRTVKRWIDALGAELRPAHTPEEWAHNAFVISLVTSAWMVLIGLAAWLNGRLQRRGVEVVALVALAALLSAILARGEYRLRRDRPPRLGIILLLAAALLIVIPFRATVLPGQGLAIAILILIIVTGISIAALPPRGAAGVVLAALLVGTGFIMYDYYGVEAYVDPEYGPPLVMAVLSAIVYAVYLRGFLKSLGFRARLVLAFIVVGLLPLIVLATVNAQRLSDLQNHQARTRLTQAAAQAAGTIDSYVQTQMDTLRTEALNPALRRFAARSVSAEDNNQVEQILRSFSLKDPVFITSYAILDRNGRVLLDTDSTNIGRSEAGRPYLQTPLASGRPYISNVLFYTGQPRLYASAPLRDDAGQIVGLLRAEYNAMLLQWLLRTTAPQDEDATYLVLVDDETYLRLAHTTSPQAVYQTYQRLSQSQVETLQKLGRFPPSTPADLSTHQPDVVDGLQRLGVAPFFTASALALGSNDPSSGAPPAYTTARHLERAPWLVMVRTSVAAMRQAVAEQTRTTLLLALLSTLLVAMAGLAMAQALAAPIVRLTGVAGRLAQGDLAARAEVTAQDEIGVLAATFNDMATRLQDTLTGLEQRVADRTRALELSAEVSRRLSTILDPAHLVSEVVELLQAAFSYYHVHIYLLDEHQQHLVMVGGTGEPGRLMLERGHHLPRGRGLVGQAVDTAAVVLVPDTSKDPNWLPNPLLPETRSELAVPILLGAPGSPEVLGALDVQQDTINGLTPQDAGLLLGIASQLAIALRNARQYEQAERQARQEAITAAIVDEIQRTQTVADALQVAVRELGRALAVPQTAVRLHPGGNGAARVTADQPPDGSSAATSAATSAANGAGNRDMP